MATAWVWRILGSYQSSKIELVTLAGASQTLDEISSQLPNGVYTTFRTFGHNKTLPLEPQFRRLEESAALLNKPVSLDRNLIKEALREVVLLCHEQEMRIRITLDLSDNLADIYISVEPLSTPKMEEYKKGVTVVTQKAKRDNPKAKRTSFLACAETIRNQIPNKNVNEVLLVNIKGQILEGLSSNFFAVKEGEIWTDDENVLSGIIRSIVLEEARTIGIIIHFSGVHISETRSLQEAFLTSASRSVLPIQKIDDQIIGTGKPGPITKKLMVHYQKRIQKQIEEL
jgi:branched-chain amino acid aminotransferase